MGRGHATMSVLEKADIAGALACKLCLDLKGRGFSRRQRQAGRVVRSKLDRTPERCC